MRRTLFIITVIIFSAALLAAPKDKEAVDFIKDLIKKSSNGEQGYLNSLRYFQYTATTAKNNPSSYVLSPYGKTSLNESGIDISDNGKMIQVLKDRKGKRIQNSGVKIKKSF